MNPLAGFSTWLHTLPPWSQPVVATFLPSVVLLALLFIRHRVRLHRRGEQLKRSKTSYAELTGGMLFVAALFFLRGRFPALASVLDWPDRAFPYYHLHGMQMWLGFGAAVYAAAGLSHLFAALFLRGSSSRSGAAVYAPGYRLRAVHRIWEAEK